MISGRGRGKIRPPRRNTPLTHDDSGDLETQWMILKSALTEIHTKNASNLSFEQIYRASYKMVLKKQGELLYDRVRKYEQEWLISSIMPRISALVTKKLVNFTLGSVSGVTANERRLVGEEFLKGIKASWEDHIMTMNMTTDVLMYMDRVYCADNNKASIFTSAMGLFRDHILRSPLTAIETEPLIFDILNAVLLDQIGMERDGDVINKSLIRSCIYMLEGLYESDTEKVDEKLYLTVFEVEFLKNSKNFYKMECERLLRDSDTSVWLRQTMRRLEEEQNRCQTTIAISTFSKISKIVEEEMISAHMSDFLAMEISGIKSMIENDRHEDLSLLYQVLSKVDPLKGPLKVAIQNRVLELGSKINKNLVCINSSDSNASTQSEMDKTVDGAARSSNLLKQSTAARQTTVAIRWVDEILSLKDKFDMVWKRCLNEDLIMQTAITDSFSQFINMFSRCSEYLSLFIDDNLKRGIKGKTEFEVELVLDKAVTLLQYIQDKDMFERYYKKHLARRLLYKKSESGDVEKQMISKMKQEIGNAFTTKLEGMFRDMTISDELTSQYRTYIKDSDEIKKSQIDLGINVLTTNYWPIESMGGGISSRNGNGTITQCIWPKEIITIQQSFKTFYLKERNGRQLTWLGFLGNADIRCFFPKLPGKEGILGRDRRHEIIVPTYGMIVLLLFNGLSDDGSLSFQDIQENTNIPLVDLSRILFTLSVLPKCKVLNKIPENKDFPKPGDRFTFNASFTSKSIRIKAPVVVGGGGNCVEADDERKETENRNDEHRGNVIDTVIVRIMKTRKQLTHQALLSQVISQLSSRFKPDINIMKKRIESLIEREYLERVENAPVPTYSYLA
ncbi:Cullin-3 [Golovinomyces cichoracearum]|uniref:Cullin-3 n=1 Tax=Golovinomyces cichoracearum TaxID=62708 RepID=A0A420IC26_9PEZI|nr:Cullin-3 [Golovinomyces cichoracearum]